MFVLLLFFPAGLPDASAEAAEPESCAGALGARRWPSSEEDAGGLAAAMSTQFKEFNRKNPPWGKISKHKKVGVVLCGGNVDLALLAKLFAP